MYTGNLIQSLIETVDKAESKTAKSPAPAPAAPQVVADEDDDIMIERDSRVSSPLSIDEVLQSTGYLLETANPYEALVRSVGRWI